MNTMKIRLIKSFTLSFCAIVLVATSANIHAVTAGTTISTTSNVLYSANSVPGYSVNANHAVQVLPPPGPSLVRIALNLNGRTKIFAGDTINFDVSIINSGTAPIAGGSLQITAPLNSGVSIADVGVAKPASSRKAIGKYEVLSYDAIDVDTAKARDFDMSLGFPKQMDGTEGALAVSYVVNGVSMGSTSLDLNFLNRSDAQIEILAYSPTPTGRVETFDVTQYKAANQSFVGIVVPTLPNAALVTAGPVAVAPVSHFSHNQVMLISVSDADQNIHDHVIETIDLALNVSTTGDSEVLRLRETQPDSGVFTGYVTFTKASATLNDGIVQLQANSEVVAQYGDVVDSSDVDNKLVLVDPYGKLFNSLTGTLLDGYEVHMINADTGADAVVVGDDGISAYPSRIITGSSVTDVSGAVYNFGPGEYRFPFAPPGNYQLVVTDPVTRNEYRWPSVATTSKLQSVANGAFAIALGSKGEVFPLYDGPPLHIDIPMDPLNTQIYVRRTASKDQVSAGDYMEFTVTVENVVSLPQQAVKLTDRLPLGMRYEPGSMRLNNQKVTPTISAAGDELSMLLGDLSGGTVATVKYVAAIGAMPVGKARSSSVAQGNAGASTSNLAQVVTVVDEAFLQTNAVIVGKVVKMVSGKEVGIENARIYLENGRFARTDANGLYRFENISGGVHVLQLDEASINGYQAIANAKSRLSDAWSQLVDVQGGSLWRADFYVKENAADKSSKKAANGNGKKAKSTAPLVTTKQPTKVRVIEKESTLLADGLTQPVIVLQLSDEAGVPARKGLQGLYTLDARYKVANLNGDELEHAPGVQNRNLRYTTDEFGKVQIALAPTSEAGTVQLEIALADGALHQVDTKLTAPGRDWILVGLAEGTVGYNTIKGNMQSAEQASAEDALYQDGRTALFAKGTIKGEWLATLAYDSARSRQAADDGLYQGIDPNGHYTVYGDNSQQGMDAPSSEKLYVKIERKDFYVMFGDFDTNLTEKELTQYQRTFTGLKTEYSSDKYHVVAFASLNDQAHVKDEFKGEGRSGPYALSRRHIALNSEKIVLETRDRFRNDVIVDRRELTRHVDYTIDYDTGSVVFREPIWTQDNNLNPIFVLVRYESFDGRDEAANLGVRASAQVTKGINLGVTQINEGQIGAEAALTGVDATIDLTKNTRFSVEAAQSSKAQESSELATADAYRAEVKHINRNLTAKAYVSEQDQEFGLGQQSGSASGVRQVGAEGSLSVFDSLTLRAQTYEHTQIDTDANRQLAEGEAEYKISNTQLRAGTRMVRDEAGNGALTGSDQVTAGITQSMFKGQLKLRADRDQNVKNSSSVDYPHRTRLGVDYKLSTDSTLFAEHEIADGEIIDNQKTLVGIKSTPWSGGEMFVGATQNVNNQEQATGLSTNLLQTWQVSERWSLSAGGEQSTTVSQTGQNTGLGEDFVAASIGTQYRKGMWLWASRLENRDGTEQDRWHVSSSIKATSGSNVALLLSGRYAHANLANDVIQRNARFALGGAYRPLNSRWMLLDKLEAQWDKSLGGEHDNSTKRIINTAHVNYKASKTQVSLQHGIKLVRDALSAGAYQSITDLAGMELRYDVTRQFDIGAHGNILNTRATQQFSTNTGVSVGHSAAKHIWISLGYNFSGFRDVDFSRANYTSEGVYMRLRIKFNQNTMRAAQDWLGQ